MAIYILLTIVLIYCFIVAPYCQQHREEIRFYQILDNIGESCVYGCGDKCHTYDSVTHKRGKRYFIGSNTTGKNMSGCLTTSWNLSHLVLYSILGYVFPQSHQLLAWFFIGIGFEIGEKYAYECEDPLDIVYNGLGLIIGSSLRMGF